MPGDSTHTAHIAVVGGGFTGMVCAMNLLRAGYQVTVLESQDEIGGLTASFDFGPFRWDRFYHCILTSDQALLNLLEDLGLSDRMRWRTTEVGFFSHGRLHTMTSPFDLLRFPHLSLWSKVRLGLATIYASRFHDGKGLEDISLATWTQRVFGRAVYREIWEPLFRCKLGEMRHEASAAFLWGTLRRLYSTRDKGAAKQERLGYVSGGYATVFRCLQERVLSLGARIETSTRIESIRSSEGTGGYSRPEVEVVSNRGVSRYDGAILTMPNRALGNCLVTQSGEYKLRLAKTQYLGLVCAVLVLSRRLSPFYVTNITDQSPFTGVIEMTNLIEPDVETAGFHLVYLPLYTSPDDPLFEASEQEIWSRFESGLRSIHPSLRDEDVAARFIFRERTVQPVPTLGYSTIRPEARTPVFGVYLANTAQILNNTLNNNVMVGLANEASAQLMQDIPLHRRGFRSDATSSTQAYSQGVPCRRSVC